MRQIFAETVRFWLGPIPVTDTMVVSSLVSLFVLALGLALRRAIAHTPGGTLAALAYASVESLDALVASIVGRPVPRLAELGGSLMAFIAACNLAGELPGVHAPTADLATTSALAAIVFCAAPVAGIATRGLGAYLGSYVKPNPLLLPLHLISEISRTFALAMRLFGNILSGQVVVALLVALTGLLVPVPMMALDVLIGLLQAYIFGVLTSVYVGAALRGGDG
jgi:F-type H+-transporting ATPase subunit a